MLTRDTQAYYRRWLIKAPIGLAILGFGIALIGESIMAKANATSWNEWFYFGTLSLIVFNAGLCIVIDAVKDRAIYEIEMRQSNRKSS